MPFHLPGQILSPKYQVYVQSKANCNSSYQVPLNTVLFCLPLVGTVNEGMTVSCCTLDISIIELHGAWAHKVIRYDILSQWPSMTFSEVKDLRRKAEGKPPRNFDSVLWHCSLFRV